MARITLSDVSNASLDRLTDELAAAAYPSEVGSINDARRDVAIMLHEMFGPFNLCDSDSNDTLREATQDETVDSVLAGPEGHIVVDWRSEGGWNGEDYRRCYVAE